MWGYLTFSCNPMKLNIVILWCVKMPEEEIFNNWISYLNSILRDENISDDLSSYDYGEDLRPEPAKYEIWLMQDENVCDEIFKNVINRFFSVFSDEEVTDLISEIRNENQTICGTYTREVAETIVIKIINFSQDLQINIKCLMRKEQEYVSKKS